MSEQLYVEKHGDKIVGYAYGEPWVSMALYMGDWRYDTEEEARAAWEKYKKDTGGREVCI